MTTIEIHDFYLVVSMGDLVVRLGESGDDFAGNELLQEVLSAIGVTVDLRMLYFVYFDQTPVGAGDVYVYRSAKDSLMLFALNAYRDWSDQLDIVSIGVSSGDVCIPAIRENLRSFFDQCSCQVHYEEASYSSRLRNMIDVKKYPQPVGEYGYQQRIFHVYG